jgi:precorrin-6A synthase
VLVIGIGPGGPDQITVQAIRAIGGADVLFEIDRTDDLVLARREICERHLPPGTSPRVVALAEPRRDRSAAAAAYVSSVDEWRARRADVWEQAIGHELDGDGCGAFLVWGDPSLYDSTIAVLDQVLARGRVRFEYDVVPGVSSLHALTAAHRIPLNRVAGPVLITTGRRLAEAGMPDGVGDVFVMLDGSCAFTAIAPDGIAIYWGAYVGTSEQLLIAGPLAAVADQIERVRGDARARRGWVMDCYLLRRS